MNAAQSCNAKHEARTLGPTASKGWKPIGSRYRAVVVSFYIFLLIHFSWFGWADTSTYDGYLMDACSCLANIWALYGRLSSEMNQDNRAPSNGCIATFIALPSHAH
ncbi:hypothetical protein AcW1_005130 [Taiwanofungus camphoratus]|nr:hypothetical protein AcV5_001496 [Antrodia cinnamomea]KAI0941049.1 hypothetical protein AcV7_002703 [Antrodia cinnamomea]KAI0960671.1 hypothetical protein AcW1_005130 [Antrodia cinnamomea]